MYSKVFVFHTVEVYLLNPIQPFKYQVHHSILTIARTFSFLIFPLTKHIHSLIFRKDFILVRSMVDLESDLRNSGCEL